MANETDAGISLAVAYHQVTLMELRELFDQVDFDLKDVLERELDISGELAEISLAVDAFHAKLRALGVAETPGAVPHPGPDAPSSMRRLAHRGTTCRLSPLWTTSA